MAKGKTRKVALRCNGNHVTGDDRFGWLYLYSPGKISQRRINVSIWFSLPSTKVVMEVRSANTAVVNRGKLYLGM
jgi:hypothetical protein